MTQPSERLTHGERLCLQLAARGQSTDTIAEQFDGCVQTVEKLLASARRKLMADTTVEALARAIKQGLIE